MQKLSFALLLAATASPTTQAEGWYGSAKLNSARQDLANALLTSPRVTARVDGPNNAKTFTGSFAAGYALREGWRLEGEYTLPGNSTFKSYWAPFNANVNSLHTRSQRLMLNGYKDIPITPWLSFYSMAGVGVARIDANGTQANDTRRFASHRQAVHLATLAAVVADRVVRGDPVVPDAQGALLPPQPGRELDP